MNENNRDQQLFNQLRQSPTELTLKEMESFIQKIPSLPPKPIKPNNWNNFLNLNNIIMGTILCVIIGLFSFLEIQKEIPIVVQTDQSKIETIKTEIEDKVISSDLDLESLTPVVDNSAAVTTAVGNLSTPPLSFSKEDTKQDVIVTQEQDLSATGLSQNTSTEDIALDNNSTASAKIEKPKPSTPQKKQRITNIPQPKINIDPKYPDLGGLALRRLKRILLRNLSSDNLIKSKSDSVEIVLPGDQIIVNGQVLNSKLFLKYSRLTEKASFGPDRKIQISEHFIKVGDFTADGFKGSGVGFFVENMNGSSNIDDLFSESQALSLKRLRELEMEEDIKTEQKELNIFAQKIMDSVSKMKGRGSLFSFNLHHNKVEKIFKALHISLVEDQLFDTTQGFVLIEIGKNMIRINGKVLDQELHTKYARLFSDYRIKSGSRRQIRLSQHIIQIGDFTRNGFKGTSGTFRDDEINYFKHE